MNAIEPIYLGCLCELFPLPREKGVMQSAMVKTMPSVPLDSAFTVRVHNSHFSLKNPMLFKLRLNLSAWLSRNLAQAWSKPSRQRLEV